jgi:tetratricopeptide (TPR) repeat protein
MLCIDRMLELEKQIMKRCNLLLVLCFFLFSSLIRLSLADNVESSKKAADARQEFESRYPKPQWWSRVNVSDVKIDTYDDLLQYWQDKDRSRSQFFKAAYKAILDYPLDADIVVNAIKLMHYTSSYRHRIELQEYAIQNYFSYKNPNGKPGNSIASIVDHLGSLYNNTGRHEKSVDLIERLLKEREKEINDHLLELIHLTYATALRGQNRTVEAINVLHKAVRKYNGSWEKRLKEAIARYEGKETVAATRPSIRRKKESVSSTKPPAPREQEPKKGKPWWENNIVFVAGILLVILLIRAWSGGGKPRLEPSGMVPPGSTGTDDDIERLVMQGRKIEAIKLYRKIRNVGLAEAKDAVDQIAKRTGNTGT